MQFFGFHLMPYPYLSDQHQRDGDSSWITLSNQHFDPRRGGGTPMEPDELIERGFALVGSPATIRDQIRQHVGELGFGIFCGIFQFGSLGHDEFERSVRLFADSVMPALRPVGTAP